MHPSPGWPTRPDWHFITRKRHRQTRPRSADHPAAADTLASMDSGRWHPPAAQGPVHARLRLPGSKSITNRALVLAALSDSPSVIRGPLKARDTSLAVAALRVLGCSISDSGTDLAVSPPPRDSGSPLDEIS